MRNFDNKNPSKLTKLLPYLYKTYKGGDQNQILLRLAHLHLQCEFSTPAYPDKQGVTIQGGHGFFKVWREDCLSAEAFFVDTVWMKEVSENNSETATNLCTLELGETQDYFHWNDPKNKRVVKRSYGIIRKSLSLHPCLRVRVHKEFPWPDGDSG